jgi:WD40 repeat protein
LITFWNIDSGECIQNYEGHSDYVTCLKQTPCGKLISGSKDGLIKIWNIYTGECLKTIAINVNLTTIWCICLVSKNTFLCSSFSKVIKLLNLNTGSIVQRFIGHEKCVFSIDNLTKSQFVSCSSDTTIRIWDLNSGECLKTIETNSGWVYSLKAISCDKILSGSGGKSFGKNEIKLWDIKTGECLKTIKTYCVKHFANLSGGKIIGCSKYGEIQTIDINSVNSLKNTNIVLDRITYLGEINRNKIIVCSEDNSIKILNLENEKLVKSFEKQYAYCIEVFKENHHQ